MHMPDLRQSQPRHRSFNPQTDEGIRMDPTLQEIERLLDRIIEKGEKKRTKERQRK
jgi:hypothetical protein